MRMPLYIVQETACGRCGSSRTRAFRCGIAQQPSRGGRRHCTSTAGGARPRPAHYCARARSRRTPDCRQIGLGNARTAASRTLTDSGRITLEFFTVIILVDRKFVWRLCILVLLVFCFLYEYILGSTTHLFMCLV